MKVNKYVNMIELNDSSLLLYHQVTKQYIIFDTLSKKTFYKAVAENSLPTHLKKELIHKYFIVADDYDENGQLLTPVRNMFTYSTANLDIIVHLNYDCNLKCSYCYQNVIAEKVVMNDKTEKDVIDFIRKIVLDKNPEYIYLNFIGGEPTLHTDKMIRIMAACNKLNKSFYFSAVSNGTFGNIKKIEELLHLGLNDYFITLDGTQKDHDKYRFYESGKGSFSTIIRNLKRIQEKFPEIKIKLNSNLNDDNKNHVTELLDVLEEKEIKYPLVFSKVISTANGKFDKTIEDNDSFWYIAHKQAIHRGYKFKPYGREINLACMMKQTNCYIIGADGFLFSCIEAVGINEFRQAHINDYGSAMFEITRSQAQNIGYAYDTCASCIFLPNCDGGCYYKRSHDDFKCPKTDFKNNGLMLIKEIFEAKL